MIIEDEILCIKEEFVKTYSNTSQIRNYCERDPTLPHFIFFSLQDKNILE